MALHALAEESAPKLLLKLIGTMLYDEHRVVNLKLPVAGLLRHHRGEKVEGWFIDEAGHRQVRLRKGEDLRHKKKRRKRDAVGDKVWCRMVVGLF